MPDNYIKVINPVVGGVYDTVGPMQSRFGLCSKKVPTKTGLLYARPISLGEFAPHSICMWSGFLPKWP